VKNMIKAFLYTLVISVITVPAACIPLCHAQEAEESSVSSPAEASTIQEYLQQALPDNPERKIVLDEVTGVLTVTDTPSNQALARDLIMLWDTGPSQVKIQARFVEIEMTDIEELGVEWWWAREDRHSQKTGRFSNMGVNMHSPSISEDADDAAFFGMANETSGLGLKLGRFTQAGSVIQVYLKALQEEGKANLLSSPTVTTLSGQMAKIQLANIVPYASDFTRTNIGIPEFPVMVEVYKVAEKVTGPIFEVTPTVAGDSQVVTMDIHPEVSVLVDQLPITASTDFPEGLGYPVIDTRTAQTSVVIKSGETVVVGGLIREDENVTKKKVPFLGDVPLIGNLFKTHHTNSVKKNLVIFLTATVLNSRGEPVL